MRTMGGTAHLRRRICRFSRRPSGTEPLIHRSRPEREGGRPQPSAPASGRRVQPEPIGSPELKFPGDPIGCDVVGDMRARGGSRRERVERACIDTGQPAGKRAVDCCWCDCYQAVSQSAEGRLSLIRSKDLA